MKKFVPLSQLKLNKEQLKQIVGGGQGVLVCYGVPNPNPNGPVTA